MSTTAYAWVPISKVEEQPDGTVIVSGPVADAGPDRDKQACDQAWLDQALPEWMTSGGNVREQHDQLRAVGVGMQMHREDDGTHMLAAAVIDPVAIAKVKPVLNSDGTVARPAVLKGFSIRIKDPRIDFGRPDAPNGLIVGGTIPEVSLVDRPANPRTYFTMVKSDEGGALVLVEDPELVEATADPADVAKAEQIVAELRTLTPAAAIDKADAATDVADAMTAIGIISKLISSEAQSLADGQLGEDCDIATLLQAVAALKYFISCEQAETATDTNVPAEVADSMSMGGDVYMDATKAETPTTPPADTPPDVAKVDNAGIADIVKAAVAEATAPLRDELALVKADLAKVAAMPVAGGPVAMRTASQTQAARDADASHLRAQARDLLAKAEATRGDDPTASRGYRERATDLLSKADA